MQSGPHTANTTVDISAIPDDPAIIIHSGRTTATVARRAEPPPNIPIIAVCPHRIRIGTASAFSRFIICTVVFCKSIACCRVCIIDFRFGEEEYFIQGIISTGCSVINIIVIYNICCLNRILLRGRKGRINKVLSAVICLCLIHRCPITIQPTSHTACFPGYIFIICIIFLVI